MATDLVLEPSSPFSGNDVAYEVVNGQFRELPPMGAFEVSLAKILLVALDTFGLANDLGEAYGEMLFLLDASAKLERRPDVAFVSYQRWPRGQRVPSTNAWPVVPNLAAEVISPSNTWNEVVEKIADYFRTGVQLVWVVSPATEQVYVYTAPNAIHVLNREETLEGNNVVPGFSLPLGELFR